MKSSRLRRQQYGAVPWRRREDGTVEVLLVTSRETRRLVIPKGWPMTGLGSRGSAAQEAWEEAGVRGEISERPLGVFHYDKQLRSGEIRRLKVKVFALRVDRERDKWPEMGERERVWLPAPEAATLVDEPELRDILQAFAPAN